MKAKLADMISISLEKIDPQLGAPFPLFLLLPQNDRMVCLRFKGQPLGSELYAKLLREHQKELWLPKEFEASLPSFLEAENLEPKASPEAATAGEEKASEPRLQALGAALIRQFKEIQSAEIQHRADFAATCGKEIDQVLAGAKEEHSLYAELAAMRLQQDPSAHSVFVGNMAGACALALGKCTPNWVANLVLAATFHDVGVPATKSAAQWRSPHLWESDEQTEYKNHVPLGLAILRSSAVKFPDPVLRMIEEHHERCDGTGYPQGLQEPNIHEGAKILSIVNTFEQLCRGHETGAPLSPAEAAAYVLAHSEELGLSPAITQKLFVGSENP